MNKISKSKYIIYKNLKKKFHNSNNKVHKYHDDVSYICKIGGKEILERKYGKLKNDDLVITDERLLHLVIGRGKDAYKISLYLKDTINFYDGIYEDSDSEYENGIVYIKDVDDGLTCFVMVSLSLVCSEKANSVITGIMLSTKSKNRNLKNKKIIV